MTRLIRSAASIVGLSLLLLVSTAEASVVIYQLTDVTLAGGTAVTGSFAYDTSTSLPTASSIATVGDPGLGIEAATFGEYVATLFYPPGPQLIFWDSSVHEGIVFDVTGLTLGDTGTYPLEVLPSPYESYIYNQATDSYGFIESGSVVGTSVATPEPSSFVVWAGLGLLGLGVVVRRKKYRQA